ncbi:MAG: hypothetical protein AB1Z19_05215 [Eubacteriales bacterium]
MTKQDISKHILTIQRANSVMIVDIALYGALTLLFLIVTGSPSATIITGGLTAILVYGHLQVKKGSSRGFNWAVMINGMMAAASLWNLWMARSAPGIRMITVVGSVVIISVLFMVIFICGMRAFTNISEKIDIGKTLEVYSENKNQQKEDKTYDAKAFRQSVKDGSFEMELVYKDSFKDM